MIPGYCLLLKEMVLRISPPFPWFPFSIILNRASTIRHGSFEGAWTFSLPVPYPVDTPRVMISREVSTTPHPLSSRFCRFFRYSPGVKERSGEPLGRSDLTSSITPDSWVCKGRMLFYFQSPAFRQNGLPNHKTLYIRALGVVIPAITLVNTSSYGPKRLAASVTYLLPDLSSYSTP